MSFTIRHYRDGHLLAASDQAMTMFRARSAAQHRQQELHSSAAVIVGERANGEEIEIEVIRFTN